MYEAHGSGREQPSVKALEDILRQVIEALDDVYIIIDSVDESADRYESLLWIQTMATRWSSARWHLLITSRREPDITDHLAQIVNITNVYLQGIVLEEDIITFVDNRLALIRYWSDKIKEVVKTALVLGADGMFRWVAMQMDGLERCFNTRAVKEKLKSLPSGLEETYEQILAGSPHRRELLHMLHWLAFSACALRVGDLAEVPSVDFDAADGPCYDPDLKYSNPNIALTVCFGLVTVTDGIVKLAHFSVKEYLISDRIKSGTAAHFSLNQRVSNSIIAQTCIAYLLIFDQPDSIELSEDMSDSSSHCLDSYAAIYLPEHLRLTENNHCSALQDLLVKLFMPTTLSAFALDNWLEMVDEPYNFGEGEGWLKKGDPPLYCASYLGLQDVVERLLENGADVNLQRGWHNTALGAAAEKGHTETAKLLLKRGANSKTDDKDIFFSPVIRAAGSGCIELVKVLLEQGTDVNSLGEVYREALMAAAVSGHTEIVKLFLEHGVDVDFQHEFWGTALQAATWTADIEIVKLLFKHGADVNIQGGRYGTALHAAAASGRTEIVKLLLDRGVDINIPTKTRVGKYPHYEQPVMTALQVAVAHGETEVAELLFQYSIPWRD